jgi:hypothetical protein
MPACPPVPSDLSTALYVIAGSVVAVVLVKGLSTISDRRL